MFVKIQNILKKPYLPPRIEFEELEEDERSWLLAGSTNDGTGSDYGDGGGDPTPVIPELPVVTPPAAGSSLDMDFTMDFVINDEPQL